MLSEYISELEKKVLITLAEHGPMSGYDFHLGGKRVRGSREALMSSSKWLEIKRHLGPEGLKYIEPLPPQTGRPKEGRRNRNLFWLTREGVIMALLKGAKPELVVKNLKRYGTTKDLAAISIFADSLQKLPSEASGFVYEMLGMFMALGKRMDLKREATNREKELLSKIIENVAQEHPEIKDFFEHYFKMRELLKGMKEG